MPRRSRTTPSNDESFTPPTPSSPNAMNQGRLEIWFEGHEINRKQIIIPKGIHMSWLRAENFGNLE